MRDSKVRGESARHELLATGSLLLLLFLRFLPTILCQRLYAPFNDNVFIYGPMFSETSRIALHGESPWYLPGFGLGFPLYESPHYSPFYPFYFFGLLDYGGPLKSLYTLTYLTIFHRVILTLNFYVMLRCARISPWAAFVGASVGTLAFNTEVYSAWITIFASYTWLPLVVAGGILIFRNQRTFVGVLLLGTSAGLLALASASQAIAHALLFCGIFFGVGGIWLWKKEGPKRVIYLCIDLFLSLTIALGIAAVSVVPMYLGIDGMIRHIGDGFVLGHQRIPWEKFNLIQLTPAQLANILINPRVVEIVGSPYVGPLGLAGVILAIYYFRQLDSTSRFLVATFGAIGLYALLSACGTHFGFAYLNYRLPLINKIREAGRHLVLFVIAVTFLTGVGFDQLGRSWTREDLRSKDWITNNLIVVWLLVFFVAIAGWELGKNALLINEDGVVLWFAPIMLAVILLLRLRPFWCFFLSALLVSIAAVITPVRTHQPGVGDYFGTANTRNLAILSAFQHKVPPGNFRIDFSDRGLNLFHLAMNASYFGFKSFYNQLTPQPYEQFRFGVQKRIPVLRELMGNRYVLCAPNEKPLDSSAVPRLKVRDTTVFENPSYMHRATLIHSLAGTLQNEDDMVSLTRRSFDFNKSVFCQERDLASLKTFLNSADAVGAEDTLTPDKDEINKVSVHLRSSRPGLLILNEWFTPAWKVKVNGISKSAIRANWWQVGVPVKEGDNVVEFAYRPSLSWFLLIVNRIMWSILALGLIGRCLYLFWQSRARGRAVALPV
jgi:hypothetical protein